MLFYFFHVSVTDFNFIAIVKLGGVAAVVADFEEADRAGAGDGGAM